jgi:hypothetical protein
MIGTALAIGMGVAAAGSVASGVIAKKGADNQAKAIEKSTDQATAEQRRQYDQSRADLAPWRDTGSAALSRLAFLLGIGPQQAQQFAAQNPTVANAIVTNGPGPSGSGNPGFGNGWGPYTGGVVEPQGLNSLDAGRGEEGYWRERGVDDGGGAPPVGVVDGQPIQGQVLPPDSEFGSLMRDFSLKDFEKDPGYDFRLQEGQKALERHAASRGGALSGAAIKAAGRFQQDYASNEFSKAYDRYNINRNTKFNFLSNVAGLGQNATNATVTAGQNSANNITNLIAQGGANAAASRASGYNALANGITGGINAGFNVYDKLQNPRVPGWNPAWGPIP